VVGRHVLTSTISHRADKSGRVRRASAREWSFGVDEGITLRALKSGHLVEMIVILEARCRFAQRVERLVYGLHYSAHGIPLSKTQCYSASGRSLLGLSFWQVELAKVHALVPLCDRDEVATADVSSVLDRLVGTQIFDFLVDIVQQLTEARPSKTTKEQRK